MTTSTATLRPMLPADVPVLAAIFQAAIDQLAEDDYDEAQREAWASAADDEAAFGARLSGLLTIVATLNGAPVGFIALEGAGHLDMLYVYPAVAGQGMGTFLVEAIQKLAAGRGTTKLTVDASDNARPFFETRGFQPHHRETVAIGDCWLGRTRMEKVIAA